ncbi:hypothetical protein DMH04_45695 [Kibdelosporangium aridum]|uniref:Secreted protein n=1 Tax=Kibdelosporangium aridum TaxID=2030 RepID=A0A428YNN2_KIBAR|nr:hypothetical protein [Kibdelosporangium aridum]RSM69844.1 hypothetical protein DMH04_45695 [Kibdelosporangium aridum]
MKKLRAGAIAVASLMVMTLGTVPTAAADDTAKKLNAADFKLRRSANDADYAKLVAALPNADVKSVLDSSNRTAIRIPKEDGERITPNFAAGFLWQDGDDNTPDWYPQGITTSSDALDSGVWQDRKVVLVSWYGHKDGTAAQKGARISFIDRTDPLKPVYRHVLLVAPTTTKGNANFASTAPNHAGGIMWYGNLLYVASTDNIEVYDLNNILKVSTADDTKIGRAADGTYYAYGYQYVLPRKFTYERDNNNVRFSAISLDRSTTPDSVLVTEYDEVGDGSRLFRWNINYETRELSDTTADWAYQVNIRAMQGAAAIKGGDGPDKSWYYITRSNGRDKRGDLLVWQPGKLASIYEGTWMMGPEDMTYRPSTDEMWTVNEYPNDRYVMSVTADRFRP